MGTWLKRFWTDPDAFDRFLQGVAVGFSVWLSTPTSRGWERVIPGAIAALGVMAPKRQG